MADSFHLWTTFVTRKSLEGIKVITKLFSCCSPLCRAFSPMGHPFQSLMRLGFLSGLFGWLYPFVMALQCLVAAFFSRFSLCVMVLCADHETNTELDKALVKNLLGPLARPLLLLPLLEASTVDVASSSSTRRIVGYKVASICVMVLAFVPFLLNAKSHSNTNIPT